MKIDLGIERSEEYGDKNKIKSYKALGGAMPSALKTSAPKSTNGPSWAAK